MANKLDTKTPVPAEAGAKRVFDLEERTARFGEAIIGLAKQVRVCPSSSPLISQLVRAGTSVGANYCEANNAESPKDFRHKIAICRKEARESRHWLRMVAAVQPDVKDEARRLWKEATELNLIFGAIIRRSSG